MINLLSLTSEEIGNLDKKIPVLIPVGLIEAHGPHLAVSVDITTAEYFARNAAIATGAILAPTINYGFADEMAEYPGTIGITANTLSLIIQEIACNFCSKGFKKIIFITGHGANKIPIELAFYQIWDKYPDFKGLCMNWWSDCGITGIHHADKGETEVALALGVPSKMDLVKDFKVNKPWYKIRSRYAIDPTSGGINGQPSKADPTTGAKVVQQALEAITQKVLEAFEK